jgi:hypothetical protein
MKGKTMKKDSLELDLTGLEIEEVEIFMQEGSRGTAEFAASSGNTGNSGTNSCTPQLSGGGI